MKNLNKFLKLLLCTTFFVIIFNIGMFNKSYAADPLRTEVIDKANDFLEAGNTIKDQYVNGEKVKEASNNLYYIFYTVGFVLAIIIGIILGIQFITAGADGKAKVKESLIAYGIGCVVLFGSFGIWRFVVTILPSLVD